MDGRALITAVERNRPEALEMLLQDERVRTRNRDTIQMLLEHSRQHNGENHDYSEDIRLLENALIKEKKN